MQSRRGVKRFAYFCLLCAACTSSAQQSPTSQGGPLARSVAQTADEAGVPADLMLAIAAEEGGLRLAAHRTIDPDDHVPVAGILELRHGRLDTLALGAELMHTTEDALRADTDLGTTAGARVLAQLGAQYNANDSLSSWRRAVEILSGLSDPLAVDYADRVFEILRAGGSFPARGGEIVTIAPHPDLAPAVGRQQFAASTPDYAGAIWFDTPMTNKWTAGRPDGNASVVIIVIHDTEGGWDGSVATLQNDAGKSVHYIVDADGSRVGQFVHETDTAWHAGNWQYNIHSVGIEHVGVASDPAGYSDGLYEASRALVTNIRTRWSVPLDRTHIIGHYQVPNGTNIAESSPPCTDTLDACETSANYGGASNHRDPGYYWQWCQYMEHLGGSCTCNDAWPLWNCTTDLKEAVRCNGGTVEIEQCTGGCMVMPVGTPDNCVTSPATTPDASPTTGAPDASHPTSHPDAGNMETGGVGGGCGCSVGERTHAARGAVLLLALFALTLVARRKRS
jgi:MYXO-CTERM domain-containing protein